MIAENRRRLKNKKIPRRPYLRCKPWLDRGIAFVLICILAPYLAVLGAYLMIRREVRLDWTPSVGRDGTLFFRLCAVPIDSRPYYGREYPGMDPDHQATRLMALLMLVNVVLGDMSLVGPPPVSPREGERVRERSKTGVLSLRPGIICLGDPSSPSAPDNELLYLRGCSLRMDWLAVISAYRRLVRSR